MPDAENDTRAHVDDVMVGPDVTARMGEESPAVELPSDFAVGNSEGVEETIASAKVALALVADHGSEARATQWGARAGPFLSMRDLPRGAAGGE